MLPPIFLNFFSYYEFNATCEFTCGLLGDQTLNFFASNNKSVVNCKKILKIKDIMWDDV